jgi:GMP synthase-like glutamine amidotransferase
MFDAVAKATESETLPFPYNKSSYCLYEPIEKTIDHAKVLIVNDLLRYESDVSPLAREEWDGTMKSKLEFERKVSSLACNNIAQNVVRLVRNPKTMTVHLSELADAAERFSPDAIVMSGTFSDFDYYNPKHLESFSRFIHTTKIPVLAICGAHQLVGMAFGAPLKTLDDLDLTKKRDDRVVEYQYRFVKITDKSDPIFSGHDDADSGVWQEYPRKMTSCAFGRIMASRSRACRMDSSNSRLLTCARTR